MCLAVLQSVYLNAQEHGQLTAHDLVDSSNSASDLAKLGPYRLQAIIAVLGQQEATGTLTVDHQADNSRQDLQFTDYHEISVVHGESYATWRRPDIVLALPESLSELSQPWQITLPTGVQPGSVEHSHVHGSPALCFKIRPAKGFEIRYCFDAATHLFMSSEQSSTWSKKETVFLDYEEIDGIRFPSEVRFLQPGTVEMDERNIRVTKMPLDAATFTPPAGARQFHACRNAVPPHLIHRVEPQYPQMARIAHIMGEVRMLVTIGQDGKVQDIHAITGHPILASSAVEAVKQWVYTPQTCPSGPVSTESTIRISFRM